jgi:hypothetical protein
VFFPVFLDFESVLKLLKKAKHCSFTRKRAVCAFLVASSESDEKIASDNHEVERKKRFGWYCMLLACFLQ